MSCECTLLAVGADVTVDAATSLARGLGVPEVIIGLTLVAVGTSLPELAATVIAIVRNEAAMAVGNVVGSNIFNLLFVLGVSSTLAPVEVPRSGLLDLGLLLVLSALLLLFAMTHEKRFVRWEGAVFLGSWVAYSIFRVLA